MHPIRGWTARYRPYLVAVTTMLVAAILLRPDSTTGAGTAIEATGSGPGPTAVLNEDGGHIDRGRAATAPAAEQGTAQAAPSASPAGPRVRAGASTPSRPAVATGAAATPQSADRYPGIGSSDALAGPDCDPKTGRVRIPSAFAPQCVRPWPDGAVNGGATSTGVTATKVRLAVYVPPTATNTGALRNQWVDTFDTFNSHLELWGRQIELVFFTGTGSDEASQRADAIKVATEIKPFAATTANNALEVFSTELAARGVVMWDHNVSWASSQAQPGFRWASQIDDRTVIAHVAEYAGKRLAGRATRWAGDPSLNGTPRVFGLVHPDVWDKAVFDAQASAHGLRVADSIAYTQGDAVGAQERARVVISRLKAKKVTSLIAGTDSVFTAVLTREATNQLFRPEWVMTGWNYQDVVLFARLFDQAQWAHAFGIGPVQTLLDGTYETVALHTWHHGRPPADRGHNGNAWVVAQLFAPCLHLAGPSLTPATFRAGCFAFAPSGGSHCGCKLSIGVSFGRHTGTAWDDYTGWDDMTEKWWDPNATGTDEAGVTRTGGYYQKVDGGTRYTTGTWPASEPRAFDPRGAATYYADYTPEERPPPYEHRAH